MSDKKLCGCQESDKSLNNIVNATFEPKTSRHYESKRQALTLPDSFVISDYKKIRIEEDFELVSLEDHSFLANEDDYKHEVILISDDELDHELDTTKVAENYLERQVSNENDKSLEEITESVNQEDNNLSRYEEACVPSNGLMLAGIEVKFPKNPYKSQIGVMYAVSK